ncbi:MAG: hypothetical protein HDT43_08255 [Ruminococcaceae bacterium]|nr:hypothetical protein [Oscillospiraceae bacterium]
MHKKDRNTLGLGVGYVSVMIIFAVICLTIFAVLSFSAASSSDGFNGRSGDYLKQYYAADSAAKSRLAALDGIAKAAVESGFFEDEFETAASEQGVALKRVMNGFSAVWTEKISDRQELAVEVEFTSDGNCEITRWQSRTISGEGSESHLGVWDGSDNIFGGR